jgi:hypothetical protein
MTILTLPAAPGFKTQRFGLRSNTQTFESPLNRSAQTLELAGARWQTEVVLPPLVANSDDAAAWLAFLVKLRGQAGRFYLGDASRPSPRGVGTGTPLVAGAGATGTTLPSDGWTPSQTGILKAGDYIAFDGGATRELHLVVADANSDGGGAATLTIEPPIRIAPADNASIYVAPAQGVFRMAEDLSEWDASEALHYGLGFAAVESFT